MLTHVVCFRFDTLEHAAEGARRLEAMAGQIPELLHVEAGVDEVRSARSYDLALITRFADLAAMERYQVHPVHQAVVAYMREHATASVSVDYTR